MQHRPVPVPVPIHHLITLVGVHEWIFLFEINLNLDGVVATDSKLVLDGVERTNLVGVLRKGEMVVGLE